MTETKTATDPPGAVSTWTPERVEALKALADAGLSCSQIGRKLGVSRNAVIGKLNRLGLARGRAPAAPRPPSQAANQPRLRRPTIMAQRQLLRAVYAEAPAAVAEVAVTAERCSLLELAKGKCRWPISDPGAADFAFCGNVAVNGLPYCSGHARLAYRPPAARSQSTNAARM